ncbi:MAG: hypothetical protein WAS36_05335 [Candidatus Saccharimonadales bacterium]
MYIDIQKIAQSIDTSTLPKAEASSDNLYTIFGVVIGTLASVAVLIIVIAGLRYILSGGDPSTMAKSKNAIVYAIVGLVVAMTAFSIVTFVVKGLS